MNQLCKLANSTAQKCRRFTQESKVQPQSLLKVVGKLFSLAKNVENDCLDIASIHVAIMQTVKTFLVLCLSFFLVLF